MQFVPVNRPSTPKKTDETEVKNVYAAKPVKEVKAFFSPVVSDFKPVEKPRSPLPASAEREPERVFRERTGEERRKYCRRLQNLPVLYDLRATADRRRKNQRKSDITTAIDELA